MHDRYDRGHFISLLILTASFTHSLSIVFRVDAIQELFSQNITNILRFVLPHQPDRSLPFVTTLATPGGLHSP
jgi:hypothetical protein